MTSCGFLYKNSPLVRLWWARTQRHRDLHLYSSTPSYISPCIRGTKKMVKISVFFIIQNLCSRCPWKARGHSDQHLSHTKEISCLHDTRMNDPWDVSPMGCFIQAMHHPRDASSKNKILGTHRSGTG